MNETERLERQKFIRCNAVALVDEKEAKIKRQAVRITLLEKKVASLREELKRRSQH